MLGEFFGMTGVSASMLQLPTSQMFRLVLLLNNRLDVSRITRLKNELEYLMDYMDRNLQFEYDSVEVKRAMRKAALVRSGSFETLKKIHNLDFFGSSPAELQAAATQLEKEAENLAKSKGSTKTIVNSFLKYKTNERTSLGEHDLLVLKKFNEEYRGTMRTYINLSKENSFREITVFNIRLADITQRAPRYLLSEVYNMFSLPTVNRSYMAKRCLEWVEIIRAHFSDSSGDSGPRSSSADESYVYESLDFERYLLSSRGQDIYNSQSGLDEVDRQLVDKFSLESRDFQDTLVKVVRTGRLDRLNVDTLVDLYFKLFRLDNDHRFISERLFPDGSDIILSLDEISSLYSRLNEIGFVFFNLDNTKLFVDCLKKISFSSETKTVIRSPDEVRNGYSFRRVVEDIEYFCNSINPPSI